MVKCTRGNPSICYQSEAVHHFKSHSLLMMMMMMIIMMMIFAFLYLVADRVGSEFWKQQERIGDDLSGMQ